uniref:C2H2-type domain-containing protein n=1 Tax=Oryzias sinensis TaxID=183150 RepID=A0A8C7WWA8_9TELE
EPSAQIANSAVLTLPGFASSPGLSKSPLTDDSWVLGHTVVSVRNVFNSCHLTAFPCVHLSKGMKGHKCDVCSREFTLSANLKRHMLIHNSVRPFQCHVCFKSFIQKMYNLLGHMHLHAGSKPFKCPYCTSKFNLKGNLSRHMKVKTVSLFSLQRKFFLKWKARATMKARTSALHHQTVWTTVAPRT